MRSMSATKLIHSYELDETGGASAGDGRVESIGAASASPASGRGTANTSSVVNLPNFDYSEAAVTARIAGRRSALQTPKAEQDALLLERQVLLDKYFAGQITRKERNRLEYVRWQLDRIEDALYGAASEFLEGAIERYERLSQDMNELARQISEAAARRK